ncbi:MAG TPA: tRNA pseudouridine(13) synthase TruD [Woeseiaceae bacterium]|nr:tRNA pseudouridine(13) synthase TruD [Woeseiaceae bacterium]
MASAPFALPDWPRAHGAPLADVQLRAAPEDFRVTEELGFAASGEGEHDLLHVRKTNANTEWVARQLARHAGVAVRDVGYSGLKDRLAVATQYFSVRRPTGAGTDWGDFEAEGVHLLEVARHHRKLRRGSHAANRFRIVARCRDAAAIAGPVAARWSTLAATGVPNYFGPQRFGHDGTTVRLALDLFAGRRLRREDRSLALSAARSLLFNRILAERVASGSWNRLLPGERVNLDGSGSVFTADALTAELEDRCARLDLHPTGSLWGEGAPLGHGAVAALEKTAVATDATLATGLGRLRVAAGHRPLRVRLDDAKLGLVDDALVFEFRLPPGAFATSVLREIVSFRQGDARGAGVSSP